MKTITCPNPECGQEHALFYWVEPNGKRKLSYTCNHIQKKHAVPGYRDKELRSETARLPAIGMEGEVNPAEILEVWSKGYATAHQLKQQQQFTLMYK